MAKFEKRLLALKMRRTGLSLKSIADKLEVTKGTVSLWCREVSLSLYQKENLKNRSVKGRIIGAQANHQKKLDNICHYDQLGEGEVGLMSNRDLLLVGAALYWAEGRKTEGVFTIINSDPDMIKLMYYWLVKVVDVRAEDLVLCLSINEMHRPRVKKVLKFWANLLQLPLAQLRKPYFVRTVQKKVYENYDSYFGVMHLKVRCGTNLRYRVQGLIKAIKKQIDAGVAELVLAPHS